MYAFTWMSQTPGRKMPRQMPRRAIRLRHAGWLPVLPRPRRSSNASRLFADQVPTWNDYMSHGTYDDYWQSRNVPRTCRASRIPVLIVASWFDAQDFRGPFRMYRRIEDKNPMNRSTLVVGPWLHGGWARTDGDTLGHIDFGEKTGEYFRRNVELPFFDYYLKDKGSS